MMTKQKTLNEKRLYWELGFRVKVARETIGMTQLELSRRIGLARGSVANIEVGRQSCGLDVIYRIAIALSVRPAQILPALTDVL